MQILVTNDDGIDAVGIKELAISLTKIGEVQVIAPETEKSACGHGITVHHPIKVKKVPFAKNINAWSVGGTPADCVKLGVITLLQQKPDIVISGINNGANLGNDVLYSGTVSGAVEGILLGIPALAISLDTCGNGNFSFAAQIATKLCENVFARSLPPDTLLNVNIPNVPRHKFNGFKVTKLGERKYVDNFQFEKNPEGNDYYWLKGRLLPNKEKDLDLDVVAVNNNYVSITPIHFDLTNYQIIEQVKKWGLENMGI